MSSVNKVIVLGNLGKDPEVRYTTSGTAVCTLSIATSRAWKSRDSGERQEETEWHRIVLYERMAELAGEYLAKGRKVYIEGRLKTRKWEKDGRDQYTTEIIAEDMKFIDGGQGRGDQGEEQQRYEDRARQRHAGQQRPPAKAQQQPQQQPQRQSKPVSGTGFDDMDDDIPF